MEFGGVSWVTFMGIRFFGAGVWWLQSLAWRAFEGALGFDCIPRFQHECDLVTPRLHRS